MKKNTRICLKKIQIKDKKIKDVNTLTNLLYDYALIMDGEKPNDISNFSKNMQEVLSKIK